MTTTNEVEVYRHVLGIDLGDLKRDVFWRHTSRLYKFCTSKTLRGIMIESWGPELVVGDINRRKAYFKPNWIQDSRQKTIISRRLWVG
jgi:hypothetical protein